MIYDLDLGSRHDLLTRQPRHGVAYISGLAWVCVEFLNSEAELSLDMGQWDAMRCDAKLSIAQLN